MKSISLLFTLVFLSQPLFKVFPFSEHFTFTDCGDPYDSVYQWGAVLPVVPKSMRDDHRQRQCAAFGCYEAALGGKMLSLNQMIVH